jgi:hypothetical protein
VLLATYVDVPRNRCHMNAGYTEKNCNLWYDQCRPISKDSLTSEVCPLHSGVLFSLVKFIHSQLLSDAA